jgi:helix-turn-helix protein
MGVRDEVVKMLKQGLSPVEIARQRNVTLSTIIGYLDQMIGRGLIRRSDVLFSIPLEIRRPIQERLSDSMSQSSSAIIGRLQRRGFIIDEDYLWLVQHYGSARYALGEIYEDIRTIEVELHKLIKQALEKEFGTGEAGWWRQGIPVDVRTDCNTKRESDSVYASEPYCYTTIIHLKKIINKQGNWKTIREHLRLKESDRNKLSEHLDKLNQIRNQVMHPVRGEVPSEDDFEFIRSLKDWLGFK